MELARNLRRDPISRLDPAPPLIVDIGGTVADALGLMQEHNTGCVLIVRAGVLCGLFTERDLILRVLSVGKPLETPIETVYTPNPVTITAQEPVKQAIRLMKSGSIRHLPVVDADNRPTATLSVKRIVRYLVEHYPSVVYNQPPDPHSVPETAEGA